MTVEAIGRVVGGLALLLLGLRLASMGPREVLGRQLRIVLELITRSRWGGLAAGIGTTLMLSSSSAATVLVVGLAEAGLLGLTRTIGVLLGTGIGTALTLQVMAFNVGAYAGFAVLAGFALRVASRYRVWRAVGDAVMGLGLIFLGLSLMSAGVPSLVGREAAAESLARLLAHPLLTFLTAAAVTAIWQSSAATILMTFPLVASGTPLIRIVPVILGANVGTCATALLACLGGTRRGLQVALAHLLFKVVGVAIVLPLLGPFTALTERITAVVGLSSPVREVAMAHTLFNVGLAALFLPMPGAVAGLIGRAAPRARPGAGVIEHIKPGLWARPEAALTAAHEEVLGMGRRALWCLTEMGRLLERPRSRLADDVVRADDKIDLLDEILTHYLTREAPDTLEPDQEEFRRKLFFVIKDIEHIGDVVSKELVPLASKLERRERGFSEQGLAELRAFHADVAAGFERALQFVAGAAESEVQEVLDFEAGIGERSRALQDAHLARLERGVEAALVTSTIHVDLLTNLRIAHAYIADIVRVVSGNAQRTRLGAGPRGTSTDTRRTKQ